MKKFFKILLKILGASLALYIVYIQADITKIFEHLKTVNPWAIMGCFLILKLAQIVSAFRMRYYFRSAGLACSRFFAIALYYVGMLFNTILPGGIGGDGYKVFLMKHVANFSRLACLRLMISNRASGLFILGLITLFLLFYSDFTNYIPFYSFTLPAAIIGLFLAYIFSINFLLKEPFWVAIHAMKYSLVIQGCCLISAAILFYGMDLKVEYSQQFIDYLVIFMVSSIASILPISIGGAGLREVTFFYSTKLLGLNSEFGVAFSLIYFGINAILALFGILFLPYMQVSQAKEHIHPLKP